MKNCLVVLVALTGNHAEKIYYEIFPLINTLIANDVCTGAGERKTAYIKRMLPTGKTTQCPGKAGRTLVAGA